MGDPHDGLIEDLDRRLNNALDRGNDEVVKELLAEIGDAELDRKEPAKRIRPEPANGAASYRTQPSAQAT